MPVDTQQIMDEAGKLGDLAAQHPAVARYKEARKAVEQDAEANRLLAEFDRQIESLARDSKAACPSPTPNSKVSRHFNRGSSPI